MKVFHADSMAAPMLNLKHSFEAYYPDITIDLISGRSKELADRILYGEPCDVFASSDPAVIEAGMMRKQVKGTGRAAASWYTVFSANELVVITQRGNPFQINRISSLAAQGIRFARVAGETDLAAARTIQFLNRTSAAEGYEELAQHLVEHSAILANTIPDVIQFLKDGEADAAVVYLSSAQAVCNEFDIVRFPPSLNLSDQIRNAATIPATSTQSEDASQFIKHILSEKGQHILEAAGQPSIASPIWVGDAPDFFTKKRNI